MIGNYKSDTITKDLININDIKNQFTTQNSNESDKVNSPHQKKDVKNMFLSGSKTLFGKVLSPTKEKSSYSFHTNNNNINNNNRNHDAINTNSVVPLMTRRELNDPFGSDEDEEGDPNNLSQPKQKDNSNSNEIDIRNNFSAPQLNPQATDVSI